MKWAFSLICLVKNLLFATVITRKAAITSTTPIPTERQMISWSPLTLPCPSNEKPQKEYRREQNDHFIFKSLAYEMQILSMSNSVVYKQEV